MKKSLIEDLLTELLVYMHISGFRPIPFILPLKRLKGDRRSGISELSGGNMMTSGCDIICCRSD